jgi:hypothetical protein
MCTLSSAQRRLCPSKLQVYLWPREHERKPAESFASHFTDSDGPPPSPPMYAGHTSSLTMLALVP